MSIFLAIYIIIVILFSWLFPRVLSNALGFLALLSYLLTLFPSLLRKLFNIRNNFFNNWLLKNRRYIGVSSFGFAVNHIVVSINITALVITVRDSRILSLPYLPFRFCPRWISKTL
jgi:hypothetical protein